jgi:Glycosyl transferases group 1
MQPNTPRVLIFSQRNIFSNALFRAPHYEFEDVISQIDSAEILAPHADAGTLRHNIANRLAYHAPVALNPGVPEIRLQRRYDLFLAICGSPRDLLMVNTVRNWRDTCSSSVCLIDEIWVKQMRDFRYFLHVLEKFDVVVLYYRHSVDPLRARIGRKCVFLPPGVDAVRFSPYPEVPKRVVDVYSIGRRSVITHQQLLRMVDAKGLFYFHDSIAGDQSITLREHRNLLANVAKRSRYFIVNPGLIDRPDIRGNQIEIGNRYFEGAASGVIMVGERPENGEFERLFDWPDAIIHLPYDSPHIDAIIDDLDKQPERQSRIRRTNMAQALKRHDWVYRWESILKMVGLKSTPELLQRKNHLSELAEAVLQREAEPANI